MIGVDRKCSRCGHNRWHTAQTKGRVINARADYCSYCGEPKTKRGQELIDNKVFDQSRGDCRSRRRINRDGVWRI